MYLLTPIKAYLRYFVLVLALFSSIPSSGQAPAGAYGWQHGGGVQSGMGVQGGAGLQGSAMATPYGTPAVPSGSQLLGSSIPSITGADPHPNVYWDPTRAYGQGFPAVQPNFRGLDGTDFRYYARPTNREVTEFQEYVFQSTGRFLNIFGQELFVGVPSTFAPLDRVPVTPDYLIGPGDELIIKGWGQVNIDYRAIVDPNGTINIRGIGAIPISGVAYKDVERHLKSAIGRVYQNFELNVSMGNLRAVQIFVVGQARRPGSYTVSSLSTVVNALFAAGGPSPRGSMRNVQLKRAGTTVVEFDLYDLLVKGDKSKDIRLLSGDVIYVPPVGNQIAISGSVNNPGIYEIKANVDLQSALKLAGGLSNTADGKKVYLERIFERRVRHVEEILLSDDGSSKSLQAGDIIKVLAVLPRIDNAVTLKGAVARPGRYVWREGMRVRDLIPGAEVLGSAQAWMRRNNIVREIDSINLRETRLEDRRIDSLSQRGLECEEGETNGKAVGIDSEKKIDGGVAAKNSLLCRDRPRESRSIKGADGKIIARPEDDVRDPSRWRSRGRVIADEWRPFADAINWDYAAIERLNPDTLETQLIPFNLGLAVLKGQPEHNLRLMAGDILTIFGINELAVPIAKQTKFVKLEGEIKAPGVYQILPGETLRQLISRIGGFTSNAYLFGAEFTRERTREQQQQRLVEAADRLESEIRRVSAAGGASRESADTAKIQAEGLLQLAAKLREAKASGRIVLDWQGGQLDVALEDGDRLFVPAKTSTVLVVGAVYNQNAFVYRQGQNVDDYLSRAGGANAFGDLDSLYVIKADGSVIAKKQTGWFNLSGNSMSVLPGDTIVVPENLDRYRLARELKDWTQIMYQFALGVAGLKVLRE